MSKEQHLHKHSLFHFLWNTQFFEFKCDWRFHSIHLLKKAGSITARHYSYLMDYSLKKKWIKIRIKSKTVQTVTLKKKQNNPHMLYLWSSSSSDVRLLNMTQITEYLLRKKGLNCQIKFLTRTGLEARDTEQAPPSAGHQVLFCLCWNFTWVKKTPKPTELHPASKHDF